MQIDLKSVEQLSDPIRIQILNAYLQQADSDTNPCSLCRSQPERKGRRMHFHGSDVGACPRKTYFTMTEGRKEIHSPLKTVFLQDGHLHEGMILKAIAREFEVYAPSNNSEKELNVPMLDGKEDITEYVKTFFAANDEQRAELSNTYADNRQRMYGIVGHIDGLLMPKDNTDPANTYLLECKSVKDYKWDQIKKGDIPDEWYGQMQIYMLMYNISVTYLLVKNRGSSDLILPIRIAFDEPWIVRRIRLMTTVYKCVNKQVEVPKPKDKRSNESECKFCDFRSKCYND